MCVCVCVCVYTYHCYVERPHSPPPQGYITYIYSLGHAVAQLVEALHYKSEDRGFDSRWCLRNFSLT